MDINSLHIFVNVARNGSFAAAARSAGTDPSLVSRAISGLEEELGFRLFQRTTRNLSLTEAGALYLTRVEVLLDELAAAHDEAYGLSADPQGRLRLTASTAFGQTCLLPLVPEFRKKYPGISLDLVLSDQNLDLVEENIDLAIRLAPRITGDVICAKLFDVRYRVVASPDYIARSPALTKPDDLRKHECLMFALPDFQNAWSFRNSETPLFEVPVHGAITMSNALGLRELMLTGLGPALLPDWLVDEDIAIGDAVGVFFDFEVTATTFDTAAWLVYPSRKLLPSKVRVAADFLRSAFRQR